MGCCCDPLGSGGGGSVIDVFFAPFNDIGEIQAPIINDGYTWSSSGVILSSGTYVVTYDFDRIMGFSNPNTRSVECQLNSVFIPGSRSSSYDFRTVEGNDGRFSFSKTFSFVGPGLLSIVPNAGGFMADSYITVQKVR